MRDLLNWIGSLPTVRKQKWLAIAMGSVLVTSIASIGQVQQTRHKHGKDSAKVAAGRTGDLAPRGHLAGQATMCSPSALSGTASSSAKTRPRTEMPAACTVSGSPETSGCHQ